MRKRGGREVGPPWVVDMGLYEGLLAEGWKKVWEGELEEGGNGRLVVWERV